MLNYLFITNKPDIAHYAEECGVSRIFVDLEKIGKIERQGHLDTVISHHCIADIAAIKTVLSSAELLVRINPLHSGSKLEIEAVINNGADIIMLPMFQNQYEVREIGDIIAGRVKFIPLVETYNAANSIQQIHDLDCVDELHIGLNDLHLEMKKEFMFQLLSDGFVESMTANLTKPFGIGGIARIGEGIIPAEYVLAEHIRLGSSSVILSRAFHLRCLTLKELKSKINLKEEIKKLNNYLTELRSLSCNQLNNIHYGFINKVNNYVESIHEKSI